MSHLYKFAYILLWTLGLLFMTFRCVYEGNFNFLEWKEVADIKDSYAFPMLMTMELFLIDVIYGLYISPKRYIDSFTELILVTIFMFLFAFSLFFECNDLKILCFILSWLVLGYMKYLMTDKYNDTQNEMNVNKTLS